MAGLARLERTHRSSGEPFAAWFARAETHGEEHPLHRASLLRLIHVANLAGSVGEKETEAEERLDELYREHPEGFVAGRDQLAKEMRAEGDREEADRIKKLRRPSVAAWLINRTALSSSEPLEEFADATRRLEEAQSRALEGDDEAVAEWRAAATEQQEANATVVETAAGLARDSGHPISSRVLELVAETLQATAGDAGLGDRVMRGRLEREETAPTLGTPA